MKPLSETLPKGYLEKYKRSTYEKITTTLADATCPNCESFFQYSSYQKRRKYCSVRCSVLAQHGRKETRHSFKRNIKLSWTWFWDNTRIIEKNNTAHFYPKTSVSTWKKMHDILTKERFYNKRGLQDEEYITLEDKVTAMRLLEANRGV